MAHDDQLLRIRATLAPPRSNRRTEGMSQQEEARRALDLEAMRARAMDGWENLQGADDYTGAVSDLDAIRDCIESYAAEVQRLRALTATAPQTQPEPYAWAVERDGQPWDVYGPDNYNIPKAAAVTEAAFWEGRLVEGSSHYHNACAFPLYRGAAPQQWQPFHTRPRDVQRILVANHESVAMTWSDKAAENGSWTHWMPLPAAPQVQETDEGRSEVSDEAKRADVEEALGALDHAVAFLVNALRGAAKYAPVASARDRLREARRQYHEALVALRSAVGAPRGQTERLQKIAEIIEAVDNRCMAADGPVTPTLQEMTQAEISKIYRLAKGRASPQQQRDTAE